MKQTAEQLEQWKGHISVLCPLKRFARVCVVLTDKEQEI